MACDTTSTTCSRLACTVCVLRSGWGKTSRWFANMRTLIVLKRICSGNRARSKSRLGSIPPLNSSRKTVSVLESLLKSVSTRKTARKTGSILKSCIPSTDGAKTITGGFFALGHSSTRLRGSTPNRRGTQGAGTNSARGQSWSGPVGCCSGGVGRQSVQQTCTGATSEILSILRPP